MKTVPSAYEQDQRIKRLELALENAQAQNAELQAKLSRQLTDRRHSGYSSTRDSSQAPPASPGPSYSRPTTASTSKSCSVADHNASTKLPTHSATVHGTKYFYREGRIAEQNPTATNTGYLQHTVSSSRKTSVPYRGQSDGITLTTSMKQSEASWNESAVAMESRKSRSLPTTQDIDDFDLSTIEGLEKATRVDDEEFYRTQPGRVLISFDDQLYFLQEAYKEAQNTLFDAVRKHWPEAWRFYYIHGPRTVRFGMSELEGTIGRNGGSFSSEGLFTAPPWGITTSIEGVIPLRNAICHPDGKDSTVAVDRLMKTAHSLACVMMDKPRADRIRELRDQLQQCALRSYEEIIAYEPLATLPNPRPWALHHQIYFRDVHSIYGVSDEMLERHGAAVVRAAEAWWALGLKPGQDDPEYIENIAIQKAKFQEALAKKALEPESPSPDPNEIWGMTEEELAALSVDEQVRDQGGNHAMDDGW